MVSDFRSVLHTVTYPTPSMKILWELEHRYMQ